MTRHLLLLILVLITQIWGAQSEESSSTAEERYFAELEAFAPAVSGFVYSDFPAFKAVSPRQFVTRLDSLEDLFEAHLDKYNILTHEIKKVSNKLKET
ncbi:hypothetical protein OKW21_003955 [Catalinimonas alkaloidigena]|uniref:hypothetical protein n=1 Tax=Catalinimonas alkaloidigena TaxID=1075417 RepID=UPI0024077564|nr:hypothetical protein [Catalinimonas alkaloidigena]MDF9798692.1 hypothetical protein [Catalinimonas alkaloidigena]